MPKSSRFLGSTLSFIPLMSIIKSMNTQGLTDAAPLLLLSSIFFLNLLYQFLYFDEHCCGVAFTPLLCNAFDKDINFLVLKLFSNSDIFSYINLKITLFLLMSIF